MNICDAQKIPHRTKRIICELPLIFKDFLCSSDAVRHKLNPNQTSNEIMRAFLIWRRVKPIASSKLPKHDEHRTHR